MRTNHAKTLLAAFAITAGLTGLAHAGEAAHSRSAPAHITGPRDPFSDGARTLPSEAALLAVSAPAGMSVCKVRGFDPYTDGLRMGKTDVYTDGAHNGTRDPYTDGAHNGTRDPYTEGGGRTSGAGNGCLYRNA